MILEMTIVFIGTIFVMLALLLDTLSVAHDDRLKSALDAHEKEYYFTQCRLMQESIEQVRAIRHDIKLHLAAINGYAVKIKADEITDYIAPLLDGIGQTETYSNTGNTAIDSIINFKLKNAKHENIQLDIRLLVSPVINIETSDIAAILGNLLDNALEAVAKVEKKKIKLDIEYSRQTLFIQAENTFDGIVNYEASKKKRLSTRKTGGEHGHGLKNIQRAIERYNGHMNITHEDNIFSVTILLYADDGKRD